ncbi:MAG: hypothetical protein JSW52_05110 [Candidatus Coatesbacteria bacterium]|nr:MAG: hypothetical protein JSW52_05110 [Candidatus Coatesbacteria bacterium]
MKVIYSFGLALAVAAGAVVVEIPVETPPDIDPSIYKRIAVVPFATNWDAIPAGELAAKAVREQIEEKDAFLVEDDETVQSTIDAMDFDPAVRSSCIEVGKALGVDAVLTGEVEFYSSQYSPEGYPRNELYTAEHERAPFIDFGPHFTTKYLDKDMVFDLVLTVKVIDVETGRLIRRRELDESTKETYDYDEFPLDMKVQRDIFDELLEVAAGEYAVTIESRDVFKERYMADL